MLREPFIAHNLFRLLFSCFFFIRRALCMQQKTERIEIKEY